MRLNWDGQRAYSVPEMRIIDNACRGHAGIRRHSSARLIGSDAGGGTIAAVIFVLLLLSALGWYGWKTFGAPHYPMVRSLSAEDGSKMKVKIVGREGDLVHAVRLSDSEKLVLDTEDFPEKIRNEILKLPEKSVETETAGQDLSPLMEKFIQLREAELAELDQQRVALEEDLELMSTLNEPSRERMAKEKLRIADWKAAELRLEISSAPRFDGKGGSQ